MPETTTTTRRTRLRTAWRAVASVPVRLLLSLGLVLGFAAVGTTAYWADTATFTTGRIEAGSLDLQLGGRNPENPSEIIWQAIGQDKEWNYSVLQLDNVSPGESVAMELWIRNIGSTPLTFTGVGTATSDDLGTYLRASTWYMGDASNTGTRDAVNRTGTCSGGTQWWNEHPLTTTPEVVRPGNVPVALTPNQEIRVCMLAGLAANAPNDYQGKSTTIKVVLTGKQVGGQ